MKNWYIVQSYSNFEKKVANAIKEEATKAKLDAANKNKGFGVDGGGCMNNSCCSDGTLWSSENRLCMPHDPNETKEASAEGFITTGA